MNPLKRVAQAVGVAIGQGIAQAMPQAVGTPTFPVPKKGLDQVIQLAASRRAKPDDVEEVVKDHIQNFAVNGGFDFREDELGDSARVTDKWSNHHYWTLQQLVQEYVLNSQPSRFSEIKSFLRNGTTKRWKLIRDAKRKAKVSLPPGGLTTAQLIQGDYAWKKGFLVELNPGDPGYDDPDTLQLGRPFNKRDFRNWTQRFQGDRQWGSVVEPALDMASSTKTDDFGKNGLGSPQTGPEMPGEHDAAVILCEPVAKTIDTLDKAVTAMKTGAKASMKDLRKAMSDDKMVGEKATIMDMLLDRVGRDIPEDPADEDELHYRRLWSALRFFGIDEEDDPTPGATDNRDAPDLDKTLQLRIKLAGVLTSTGHGHETKGHWGNYPLIEEVDSYRIQRDASGNPIFDAQGDPVYLKESRKKLAVTRHAFINLEFFQVAEWVIHAQKTSLEQAKQKVLGFLQSGEKSKYPLVPDLTVLSMGALAISLVIMLVLLQIDAIPAIALGVGILILVGLVTKVEDPEFMTTGEEWRTALVALGFGVAVLVAVGFHGTQHQIAISQNQSRTDQYAINQGLITREKLDQIAQKEEAARQEMERLSQGDKSQRPWGWLDPAAAIEILVAAAIFGLLVFGITNLQRRNYHPIQARKHWWRVPRG